MTTDGSRPAKPSLRGHGRAPARRAAAPGALAEEADLEPGRALPRLFTARVDGVSLPAWGQSQRDALRAALAERGGVLLRGFQTPSAAEFAALIEAVAGAPIAYTERSSPRSHVEANVYTSTDHPAAQPIPLHCENSYAHAFPQWLCFLCLQPARRGGATIIADVRGVLARLPDAVRQRFADRGVMYVRNFREGLSLPWQAVFQTEDRGAVEARCAEGGYTVEWRADDSLRTRRVAPAIARHPHTREPVWFNHAAFFHVSTLDAATRTALRAQYADDELPNNTYYGDGGEIEAEVLDAVRAAYRAETVEFPWQRGDVLVLDNLLVAHGRTPYEGERRVLVGMAEPLSSDDPRLAVAP